MSSATFPTIDGDGHIPVKFLGKPTQQLAAFRRTGAVAETVSRFEGLNNMTGGYLQNGRQHVVAIYLMKGTVINSATWVSATTAGASLTSTWYTLFDGQLNLLRSTNLNTDTTWASNTERTLSYTDPYTVTADGLFYVGIGINGTTLPTLAGAGGLSFTLLATPILAGRTNNVYNSPASVPANIASQVNIGVGGIPYVWLS